MIESRYAFVDRIPASLFDAVVNNGHGMLRPRAEAILHLRDELLSGRIPPPEALVWPDEALRTSVIAGLTRSRVVEACAANTQITDAVLLGILGATQAAQRRYDELIAEWTVAAREHARTTRTIGLIEGKGDARDDVLFDAAAWEKLRIGALKIAGEIARESLAELDRDWAACARDWATVRALFEDVSDSCGVPRDRVKGLLSAIDWQRSAELRRVLAGLPAIRSLLQRLGRRSAPRAPDADRVLETRGGTIPRDDVAEAEVRELGVVEIRGVERSDEIARMLASELALRSRSVTKLLWHARRAERSLLTYHAESVYTHRIRTEQGFRSGFDMAQPRAECGPIIILLDTSGTMSGPRELLAKALVLQALAVAQLENRAVYIYNFSGAGQLVEHELSIAGDGLAEALAFLAISFGGLTQIDEALRRAVKHAEREAWAGADLLLVTDGFLDDPSARFDQATINLVNMARRRRQFRVHVALAVPLEDHNTHVWFWEDGSRAPPYVGDPHWVIKEIADHIHELASWIDRLAPTN